VDLLFEIGTEEIPPSYIRPALETLRSGVGSSLATLGIEFARIRTFGTPRRMVLIVDGVDERAKDRKETVFGPPAERAFDQSGNPMPAAAGFAKKHGVDVGDLKTATTDKGEYVCVEKLTRGGLTVDLVGPILQSLLNEGIRFPKSMRWTSEPVRFARPVRWLTYVVDGKPGRDSSGSPFSWGGIQAGDTTRGHRFHGKKEIRVRSSAQYLDDLRSSSVIVDHEERKRMVKDLIEKAASAADGSIVEDEELLERVTFTVEFPFAVLGDFSKEFLGMPSEVVITALREHQDFFSVCNSAGKLMPHFVAVADAGADPAGKIKLGNERVLKARLDDAHFFWQQDLKDGLSAMADRLSHVVWQEQLGTLSEKSERVSGLARALSEKAGFNVDTALERAAHLCKADLTSLMVREKEFSSLQGAMGREYARESGEDEEVAAAIYEHYLPRFAGDALPETEAGQMLALADKLDSIVGCFGVGLLPTGSEDPYALRRQAIGVVRILMEKGIHLKLDEACDVSIELYGDRLTAGVDDLREWLWDFLESRVQTILVDDGNRFDMVASALGGADHTDPVMVATKLEAIKEFEKDERFGKLMTAFKRACNITRGLDAGPVDQSLFEDEAEGNLYGAYNGILDEFEQATRDKRFRDALGALLELAGPIDVFFDRVMVMTEDENLRVNRLNLLGAITGLFLSIADFSRLEVV
jgi:glycyl-tRNA synthetase beta chain